MLKTPEIILFNTIKSILSYVREDYDNNTDKTKTYLYKLMNGVKIGRYDFYTQGKEVFLKPGDDSRLLDVRLFFDASRAAIPTIHITLPSEKAGSNGIGIDEGFQEADFNDAAGTFTPTYNRSYDAHYEIGITSDNSVEVLLIYNFLKAALTSVFDHLELSGLMNPKISGQDIQLSQEILPNGAYMRALSITCSYEMAVPRIFDSKMISSIIIDQAGELTSNEIIIE